MTVGDTVVGPVNVDVGAGVPIPVFGTVLYPWLLELITAGRPALFPCVTGVFPDAVWLTHGIAVVATGAIAAAFFVASCCAAAMMASDCEELVALAAATAAALVGST